MDTIGDQSLLGSTTIAPPSSVAPLPSSSPAPAQPQQAPQDYASLVKTYFKNPADQQMAMRTIQSEGGNAYVGDQGSSFGPFQLHYGGVAPGGNAVSGLGDAFTKQTGLNAGDPNTVPQQMKFVADYVAQHGWDPNVFHGLRAIAQSTAGLPQSTAQGGQAQTLQPPDLSQDAYRAQHNQAVTQDLKPLIMAGAVAVAALGVALGARGHGKSLGAMAGLAGFVNGLAEGEQEKAREGLDAYKTWVENTQRDFENRRQVQNDILRNDQLTMDQKLQKLQLHAAEVGDSQLAQLTQQKNLEAIDKHRKEEDQHLLAAQKLAQGGDAILGQFKFPGQLSDDAIDLLAQRVIKGDNSGLTGLGYGKVGAQNRSLVQARVAEIAKEQGITADQMMTNQASFGGRKQEIRSLSQLAAKSEGFAESTLGAFDYAIQASNKVPRGNFVPLTRLEFEAKRATSDSPLAVFNAANETAINEYSRTIGMSGVATDTAKQHAREMLETANSPETYKNVVNGLKFEVENVKRAMRTSLELAGKGQAGGTAQTQAPTPGTIKNGYLFKGGDPADKASWERVQ